MCMRILEAIKIVKLCLLVTISSSTIFNDFHHRELHCSRHVISASWIVRSFPNIMLDPKLLRKSPRQNQKHSPSLLISTATVLDYEIRIVNHKWWTSCTDRYYESSNFLRMASQPFHFRECFLLLRSITLTHTMLKISLVFVSHFYFKLSVHPY